MNTEELLRENAPLVREALLASLPDPEDCDHVFSRAFERKMRRLLRRQAHPLRYRAARRAAALFLASLLGVSAWLTVDTNARAAFFQWVREVYETHIVYRFTGEQAEKTAVYRPGWVPEGYEEFKASANTVLYTNKEGKLISFSYSPMQEGTPLYITDTDNVQIDTVEINEISGEFYLSMSPSLSNVLIWLDNDIEMYFHISGFLSKYDMLHMAESVFLLKSTNSEN